MPDVTMDLVTTSDERNGTKFPMTSPGVRGRVVHFFVTSAVDIAIKFEFSLVRGVRVHLIDGELIEKGIKGINPGLGIIPSASHLMVE